MTTGIFTSSRETNQTRQCSTVVGLQTGCPVRGLACSDPAGPEGVSGRVSGTLGPGGGGADGRRAGSMGCRWGELHFPVQVESLDFSVKPGDCRQVGGAEHLENPRGVAAQPTMPHPTPVFVRSQRPRGVQGLSQLPAISLKYKSHKLFPLIWGVKWTYYS